MASYDLTVKGHFDAARRVFTLDWVLEPGRTYGFSLNCAGNAAFVSEDGVPLESLEVVFATREQ